MKYLISIIIGFTIALSSSTIAAPESDSTSVIAQKNDSTSTPFAVESLKLMWAQQRELAEQKLQGTYNKEQRELHDLIKAFTIQIGLVEAIADSTIRFKKEAVRFGQ